MWANQNFLTSDEQASHTKAVFDESEIFATENLKENDAAELLKRFNVRPINPWGKLGEAEAGETDLNKVFGFTPPNLEDEFNEREPFDAGDDADRHFSKAMGGEGHFHIQKSANGTECAVDCHGKTVACRTGGASFSEKEISELRSRCSCESCKES